MTTAILIAVALSLIELNELVPDTVRGQRTVAGCYQCTTNGSPLRATCPICTTSRYRLSPALSAAGLGAVIFLTAGQPALTRLALLIVAAAALVDIARARIPNTYATIGAVLTVASAIDNNLVSNTALGAALLGGVFLILTIASRGEGFSAGDVKLASVVGGLVAQVGSTMPIVALQLQTFFLALLAALATGLLVWIGQRLPGSRTLPYLIEQRTLANTVFPAGPAIFIAGLAILLLHS